MYSMRARMICCPRLSGCDFASSGGLFENICSSSGVWSRVCVGFRSLLRGISSRSGPSVVEKVGRAGGFGMVCFVSIIVLS